VEDLSDIEREEQLRRWWSENWLWIFGGVVLGLGALAGWQYWQKSRFTAAEADEASYIAVLESLSKQDEAAAAKTAGDLRALHPKSPYADQADLALARAEVGQQKFDEAARRLRTVADSSRDPELRLVARSRLARVLAEQGKHDDALALLDPAQAGAFAPLFHEIRGDVLAAKGDVAGAREEYAAALAADAGAEDPRLDRAYVELKRDALSSAPAPAPAAAATPTPTTAPESGLPPEGGEPPEGGKP
jgi:predicted negative regulator of RcsB-dependent stress response